MLDTVLSNWPLKLLAVGLAFAIWVSAGHVDPENLLSQGLIVSLVFLISGIGSASVWTLFGVGIGRVLGDGWRLRAFNVTMATLLVASGIWMMMG